MEWVLAVIALWVIYVLREALLKLGRKARRKVVRALRELAWCILAVTLPAGATLTRAPRGWIGAHRQQVRPPWKVTSVSEVPDPDDDATPLPHWTEVEEIFLRTSKKMSGTLLIMLKSPQDVEDVLQEAVVKACRRYDTLRQPENHAVADRWFKKIATNVALDRLRRAKRDRRMFAGSTDEKLEEVWKVAASQLPPDEQAVVREALDFIDATLSGKQRMAYLLRHWMGLKNVDIADVMGCSAKNVDTHIARAQAKIDKEFNPKPQSEPREVPFRLRGGSKA